MLTLRTKLILAYTAALGVMLLGFAFLVYRSSRDAETAALDSRIEAQGEKIQSEIEEQYDEGVFPAPADLRSIRTEGLMDYHFRIFDTTGTVVLNDDAFLGVPPPSTDRAVDHSQVQGEIRPGGSPYRLWQMPLEINGRHPLMLQMVSSTADIDVRLRRLRLLFVITIPAVLLLASLSAYVMTRTALRPITSMIETARRISADNLDARLRLPEVRDEIRLLGETLNSMMERISGSFRRQRQFIADASHELRTPLTVICSELEFARKQSPDPAVRESIGVALAEVDRLGAMTQGMLMLTKLDMSPLPLQSEKVRLDELLPECVHLLKSLFSARQIGVRLQIDDAVEIDADRDKLKGAFLNILDNAIRYSHLFGKVAVSLQANGPHAVTVRVEDNGAGIAAEDLPHIFERFYRSASARAGTTGSGLGLAIVDQVVRAHGGTVSVRSEPGKGSVFTLELPVRRPANAD